MPENDDTVIRGAFEAFAAGGVERSLPFFHEEFEMTTPVGLAAEPDTYRGHEGVRRWVSTFYEIMDEISMEPLEIVPRPADDRFAMRIRLTARGRASGAEVVQEAATLVTVRDGKVSRIEFFGSFEEALAR
jgi:ketosteroid isomerase-like protein